MLKFIALFSSLLLFSQMGHAIGSDRIAKDKKTLSTVPQTPSIKADKTSIGVDFVGKPKVKKAFPGNDWKKPNKPK